MMKISLLILSVLWSFLAPMPPGIAVNPDTRECGEFFGGDEYGSYIMPSPWEITYNPPIPAASSNAEWDQSVREYCEKNGFTYVPGNMGKIYGTHKNSGLYYTMWMAKVAPLICLLLLIIIVGLIVWIVVRKKRTDT